MITCVDDGKCKWQSVTATLDHSVGNCSVVGCGFGGDAIEARRELTSNMAVLLKEVAVMCGFPNVPDEDLDRVIAFVRGDPDLPRRFRFPCEDNSCGRQDVWRYAVYFPRKWRWYTEYGFVAKGEPDMPGLEWIDPAEEGE